MSELLPPVGSACYLGPGALVILLAACYEYFFSAVFLMEDTKKSVLGMEIHREKGKDSRGEKKVFTQESGVYIYGWIHKVGWAWERSSSWMQRTPGKLRQTSGLSKSSEINRGWIIYTPRPLWEKCLCSLCIEVIEWEVLYGPFGGKKMNFGAGGPNQITEAIGILQRICRLFTKHQADIHALMHGIKSDIN